MPALAVHRVRSIVMAIGAAFGGCARDIRFRIPLGAVRPAAIPTRAQTAPTLHGARPDRDCGIARASPRRACRRGAAPGRVVRGGFARRSFGIGKRNRAGFIEGPGRIAIRRRRLGEHRRRRVKKDRVQDRERRPSHVDSPWNVPVPPIRRPRRRASVEFNTSRMPKVSKSLRITRCSNGHASALNIFFQGFYARRRCARVARVVALLR